MEGTSPGIFNLDKRLLKGLCHAIWYVFKKLNVSSHRLNPKNNGMVLLLKTIIIKALKLFPVTVSSVAADGKDGNGLKIAKLGHFFFKF